MDGSTTHYLIYSCQKIEAKTEQFSRSTNLQEIEGLWNMLNDTLECNQQNPDCGNYTQ